MQDPKFGHTFTFEDLPKQVQTYRTVESEVVGDISSISVKLLNLSRYESTLFNQVMRLLNCREPYALVNEHANASLSGGLIALQRANRSDAGDSGRSSDGQSAA